MTFEARYSILRLSGQLLVALLFVGVGLRVVTYQDDILRQILGAVVLVMFAISAGVFLLRMTYVAPVVRVDANGIYSYHWSPVLIAWDNLAQFSLETMGRNQFVSLTLINRDHNPPKRLIGKMNRSNRYFGYGDIGLSLDGTDGDYTALLEILAHYHRPA